MISILKNIWNGIKGVLGWLDTIFGYVASFLKFIGSGFSALWGYVDQLPAWLVASAVACLTVGILIFVLGRSK